MSLLSLIRSLLSELSFFGFPLLRRSKGYTLDSGLKPARSEKKKKHWNPYNRPNSSAESLYRVKRSFSDKFQAKFVPTAAARYKALNRRKIAIRTRRSCCRDPPWTLSKPELNAGLTNWLWPGEGSAEFSTSQVLCSMIPWGDFCSGRRNEHCYDKPIKATTRRVYKLKKKVLRSHWQSRSIKSFDYLWKF